MAVPRQPARRTADPAAVRGRTAVTALFAVNGFAYTNIVPWLPTIKADLGLSNTALGAAIAALPMGALLTGILAGPLIARWGSGRTSVGAGLVMAAVLPTVALAPSWAALAAALFALGCADAWMDAAMNTHGLHVQRRYGRTIINAFHGVWSVAAVCGGLAGSATAGAAVPLFAHLCAVAVVLVAATLWASRRLLPANEDTGPGEEPAEAGVRARFGAVAAGLRRAAGPLLVLSVLLMASSAVEDSAASWGAVLMHSELGATAFWAGMPFVACQAMMTVGRLTGDRLTDRLGPVAVVRGGALLAACGVAVAASIPAQPAAVAGFALVGLGVATMFPLTLAAAGAVPGVRSGDGVTVVGWLGRLGFLAFPPLIGVLADASSLSTALWAVAAAAAAGALLAPWSGPRKHGA
ncbi:MFS transporter [Nocardiopsis coralliicola]